MRISLNISICLCGLSNSMNMHIYSIMHISSICSTSPVNVAALTDDCPTIDCPSSGQPPRTIITALVEE